MIFIFFINAFAIVAALLWIRFNGKKKGTKQEAAASAYFIPSWQNQRQSKPPSGT